MMYDSFIGLEIHIHLLTDTKAFCGCKAEFGAAPNTHVCPVCLGYPGVLPQANERAMHMAYLVARALNCTLAERCFFDRKNYFYPDMSKNYQISQFHCPVGVNGAFTIEVDGAPKTVRIHDVHFEEDAGKMIHKQGRTLVDYNRAGTALLEIVTEPDMSTGAEAEAFIREFRRTVRHLGVCDGNMEEGSLRCDANVSVNRSGCGLGTKTEVKNLNSARFVRKALEYEIRRQKRVLDRGEKVVQETRLWDADRGVTETMRTKEKAHDYRYFPEPDMPPFCPDAAFLQRVEEAMVVLPLERKRRYQEQGVAADVADFLAEDRAVADLFEDMVAQGVSPKRAANWLAGDVQAQLKRLQTDAGALSLNAEQMVALDGLVESGALNRSRAKEVIEVLLTEGGDPRRIVAERGWEQVGNDDQIDAWVSQVFADNPDAVRQAREGNGKIVSYLMGQVMRLSKGKADPKRVRGRIDALLQQR